MRTRDLLFTLVVVATAPSVAADNADLVLVGGRIYTVDAAQPWASAVAIRDKHFVYVGDDAGSERFVGPSTRVVNLGGRMAMPGIHDAHAHLLISGLQNTVECRLPHGTGLPDVIGTLKACESRLGPGEWLVGGPITYTQFPNDTPHGSALDEAFPERPVFLDDDSLHHALVNSTALAIAGVSRDTVDPSGGRIVKDPHGEPTGMLLENATWLVRQHIPASADRDRDALLWAVRQYNRVGVTSVQEASANRRTLVALRALDEAGELPLDVAAHFIYGNQSFGWASDEGLQALIDERETFRTPRIHPDFIKMWVDGAPLPPWFTSAEMDFQTGKVELEDILIPPPQLNALLVRFDAEGLKTKLHVAGHGAAHVAIDAIAAARQQNPASRLRHELAHCNSISPADMVRMGQLGIVGEVSPALWHVLDMLGNPPKKAWEFRSLQDRNVLITMGTDWVVTPSPNLFVGLQGMLQRGDESIGLTEAIRTMTINGAIALGWEARQGSIEIGKVANLIVLDRNVFEVPADDIGATTVVLTIFQGKTVHSSDPGFFAAPTAAP